ncbi:hypothetical protein AYO20_08866 [Fonsecaea nubica]|uniref:Uncharacterized protein n=1 Tax=Fonsecaea nubica TaxID=856822 RepID=A0A178CJJ6_9EURO|nr:hypothetical protein AYO20_08866 [Fonsecaea nubica]OAL30150.1 hypothetical protein AYO20_08866 [Fonsecaea nubica]
MQSLPHRRRSDAGPQAASQAQVTTTDPSHIDATERPALSSKQCDNNTDTLSHTLLSLDHSASNSLNPPLTVPAIFKQVQDRQSGRVPGTEWNTYHVTPSEWATLRELLEGSDICEKLRVDYFSQTEAFVQRMPSFTHEYTSRRFHELLKTGLASICHGTPEEGQFMKQIRSGGSSDVDGVQGPSMHEPDDYIFCRGHPFYGLVLEVAYSQKSKELENLARFYLFEADRNVQKVIGISIDYDRSKKVTLHTWQRDSSDTTTGGQLQHSLQEVRTETGAWVPGPPLQISVLDIAPLHSVPSSLYGATIQIPLDELCEEIEYGERTTTEFKEKRKARQCQNSDPLDRDDDDSSQQCESDDDAGTERLDEDYVPSRVGCKGSEPGGSPIGTRSRTNGAFDN